MTHLIEIKNQSGVTFYINPTSDAVFAPLETVTALFNVSHDEVKMIFPRTQYFGAPHIRALAIIFDSPFLAKIKKDGCMAFLRDISGHVKAGEPTDMESALNTIAFQDREIKRLVKYIKRNII